MWPHHPPTSMLHHPKQFLLLLSDRVAEQGENESGPAGDVTTEPQRQKNMEAAEQQFKREYLSLFQGPIYQFSSRLY